MAADLSPDNLPQQMARKDAGERYALIHTATSMAVNAAVITAAVLLAGTPALWAGLGLVVAGGIVKSMNKKGPLGIRGEYIGTWIDEDTMPWIFAADALLTKDAVTKRGFLSGLRENVFIALPLFAGRTALAALRLPFALARVLRTPTTKAELAAREEKKKTGMRLALPKDAKPEAHAATPTVSISLPARKADLGTPAP